MSLRTIVVIEDDPVLRRHTAEPLEAAGLHVLGSEAGDRRFHLGLPGAELRKDDGTGHLRVVRDLSAVTGMASGEAAP